MRTENCENCPDGERRASTNASASVVDFSSLRENVGRFDLRHKKVLIPEMNRVGSNILAGAFRSFGIDAVVMPTYEGLELGMAHTSGKECYPCQVTLGDVLYFLEEEKKRLGTAFEPGKYIYFLPQAEGPCRFGMYNKYQRLVLDTMPEFKEVKIGALSTNDSYSLDGLVAPSLAGKLRRTAYLTVIVSDILDRLLWCVRPYERSAGSADRLVEEAIVTMARLFELHGAAGNFRAILGGLDGILEQGAALVDPGVPRKPKIGVVGEIYLRTHVRSNQDTIRNLEKFGAEVVNASIGEWVNFTTYDRMCEIGASLKSSLKLLETGKALKEIKEYLGYRAELFYQERVQSRLYRRAARIVGIADDHKVGELDRLLGRHDLYDFRVGTEACLSISAAMAYVEHGYSGVVNIYPFTCMPGTITSSVLKPLLQRLGVPYLDAPYDSSYQPGREGALRTFVFQAQRHHSRNAESRS